MGNACDCEDIEPKGLEIVRIADKDKVQSKVSSKRQPGSKLEHIAQDGPDSFQTGQPQSGHNKPENLTEPIPDLNQYVLAALDKEHLTSNNFQNVDPILGPQFDTFPVHYLPEKQAHYQGHWHNNQPHGKGAIYFKTGAYFQGELVQGQVQCSDGILVLADGSYYRGAFNKSVFQGTGTFISTTGTIYQGEWEDGVPHGQGEQRFVDGNRYKGTFVNGKKQGTGSFRWDDGRVYEGQFKNGMMHGNGKFFIKDQEYFEGQFFENRKIGQDQILKTAQGTYQGTFDKDDIIRGKFQWNDQTIYEGEFRNGLPHGQGTLIYPQGRILVGTWEEGKNIKIKEVKSQTRSRSKSRSSVK